MRLQFIFFVFLLIGSFTRSYGQELYRYKSEVLFEDQFDNNKNNWPTKFKDFPKSYAEITDGFYRIHADEKSPRLEFCYNLEAQLPEMFVLEFKIASNTAGAAEIRFDSIDVEFYDNSNQFSSGRYSGVKRDDIQSGATVQFVNKGDRKSVVANNYELKQFFHSNGNSNMCFSLRGKGDLMLEYVKLMALKPLTDDAIISQYISLKLATWLEKGRFEKTIDFEQRVSNDNIGLVKDSLRQEIVNTLAEGKIKCHPLRNDYNADEEYFSLDFFELNTMFAHVPVDDAKEIGTNFCRFEFQNANFHYEKGKYTVKNMEMVDKNTGKKFYAYNNLADAQHYNKQQFRDVTEVFDEVVVNQIEAAKNYALIIGINDYEDDRINDLNNPIADGRRIKDVLLTEYTFYSDNIYSLENPSRTEVIKTFDELSKKITSKDNLLIFYAGHGTWDENLQKGYWLPSDASKDDRANWFSNSLLKDYISGIKSKHTLLISDACFSGGIFKTRNAFYEQKAMQELYKLPSRKAITSGAMNTVPDKSVFLDFLIKRLQENQNKTLTAEQLFSSFRIAVINNSPNSQVPLYGDIKETGDEGGDFIFVRK